jgi:hypothetical protein
MKRFAWLVLASAGAAILCGAAAKDTGGQDNKVVLSDEQFNKLVAADAKFLHDALAKDKVDKKLARKVQAAAVMVSACAECATNPESATARRNADALFYYAEKGEWLPARKISAGLYPNILDARAKAPPENKLLLPYMYYFSNERVGGFGVEQELGELQESKDKLNDAQFARLSDIGIRCAVIGQVADRFGPEKDVGKLTRQNWQTFTAEFRQAALALTTAAAAKKEAETRKALEKLDAACTKCHDVFK